ncbi:MAG TPA: sigma-70 family RNA polymerase sigma factor [Lacunisphaera sp.]|jgi:RNA polymerase sigma factor (sigma-70 family)
MALSDEDLLRDYLRTGSNPAFSELVHRYVNPVYSAALRQVRSTALAGEVAQSVFIDLSQSAAKLKPGQPLIAWLYLVTRRTAIDTIRRESRRQARETIAAEIATMKSNPSPWAQVEPFLDEAIAALNEADQRAVLLRFIAGKSLRKVGDALGISDDAVQKRISRALEQLRTAFARRGVAMTAAGLATDLSAHIVVAAPAGLGASISAGALSAGVVAQTTHAIAMNALNKTLIAVSIVLAAGFVYQTHLIVTQQRESLKLEEQIAAQDIQATQLQADRNRAEKLLAEKQKELEATQARASENAATEADLDAWLGRVSHLREWLGKMPEKNIPEMKFLTSSDWLKVTLNNDLATNDKVRKALSELRRIAKDKPEIAQNIETALRAYAKDHDGQAATDVEQLRRYLQPQIDDDILQRYHFVSDPPSKVNQSSVLPGRNSGWLVEKTAVDEDHDVLLKYSDLGRSVGFQYISKFGDEVDQARQSFVKANNGKFPASGEQLLPYFTPPIDEVRLKDFQEAGR